MEKKYYITNELAVDQATERELLNNGEYADARVSLVTAKDEEGSSHYYLQTNGDPVVLLDGDVDHNQDWIDTLGLPSKEIIAAIAADGNGEDQAWAIQQLSEVAAEEEEID